MKKFTAVVSLLAIFTGLITCAQIPNSSDLKTIFFKPAIITPLEQNTHVLEGQSITLRVDAKGTRPFTYN